MQLFVSRETSSGVTPSLLEAHAYRDLFDPASGPREKGHVAPPAADAPSISGKSTSFHETAAA